MLKRRQYESFGHFFMNMAGQRESLPLLPVQLHDKLIDGASLVHPAVEAHSCVQLRRWLKCHGRSQGVNKAELVERVKNAMRNRAPIDPGLDEGKWLKLQAQNQNHQSTSISLCQKVPEVSHKFPLQIHRKLLMKHPPTII